MLKSISNVNWIAIAILVIVMIITVIPISYSSLLFVPNWLILALSICYIIVDSPINMGFATTIGIFFDVLTGSVFGVNSLCLVIAVYALSKYTAEVLYYNIYRELLFIFCLTFFLTILKTSLLRMSFFPVLLTDYACSTIGTSLIWLLLRLCSSRNKSYLI